MIKDWERYPSPTPRDTEKWKSVDKAVADIELAAQGKAPNQALTKSLAIVLLEVLKEVRRTGRDTEHILTSVRALLKSLASDHADVREYLGGGGDVHRRGDEPSLKRR